MHTNTTAHAKTDTAVILRALTFTNHASWTPSNVLRLFVAKSCLSIPVHIIKGYSFLQRLFGPGLTCAKEQGTDTT
jgi:hypothetical protein